MRTDLISVISSLQSLHNEAHNYWYLFHSDIQALW